MLFRGVRAEEMMRIPSEFIAEHTTNTVRKRPMVFGISRSTLFDEMFF